MATGSVPEWAEGRRGGIVGGKCVPAAGRVYAFWAGAPRQQHATTEWHGAGTGSRARQCCVFVCVWGGGSGGETARVMVWLGVPGERQRSPSPAGVPAASAAARGPALPWIPGPPPTCHHAHPYRPYRLPALPQVRLPRLLRPQGQAHCADQKDRGGDSLGGRHHAGHQPRRGGPQVAVLLGGRGGGCARAASRESKEKFNRQ